MAAKISFSRFDRRFWLIFGVILPNPPAPTRHRSGNAIFWPFSDVFGSFCQILLPQRDIDLVTLFSADFLHFSATVITSAVYRFGDGFCYGRPAGRPVPSPFVPTPDFEKACFACKKKKVFLTDYFLSKLDICFFESDAVLGDENIFFS